MSAADAASIPQSADVWLVMRKASYWVQQHALDSVAATGLGLTDFAVLKALLFTGPLPVNVIGANVLMTSRAITPTFDRLLVQASVIAGRRPTVQRLHHQPLTADKF